MAPRMAFSERLQRKFGVTGAEAVEIEDALTRVAPSRAFLAKVINPSISIFASSVDGAEHM